MSNRVTALQHDTLRSRAMRTFTETIQGIPVEYYLIPWKDRIDWVVIVDEILVGGHPSLGHVRNLVRGHLDEVAPPS